jgi:hypothetical protein
MTSTYVGPPATASSFDHVNFQRGDLYEARLTSARFFDCDLRGLDVSDSRLRRARFHGSDLSEIKGAHCLRDVLIESSQVLPLAIQILAALKVRIEDDRDVSEFE